MAMTHENWKNPWGDSENKKISKRNNDLSDKETPEGIAKEMSEIKDKISELELKYQLKNKELIYATKHDEYKVVVFFKHGKRFTAKLVEGTRTVVNEDALKKLIPASIWETVLVSKVDQTKLSRAITSGEIDAEIVAEAVAVVPSAPYWRFTDKGENDNVKPIS